MSARTWKQHRKDLAKPVAAPLEVCARHLSVPEPEVRRAAERIGPYWRADGHPVWSLRLLERALRPQRFHRPNSGGAPTRRRTRGSAAA
jgi:hypothetical protein